MVAPTQTGNFALGAGQRSVSIRTFAAYLALAGIVNATIASFILCRLPASQVPTMHSLLVRAVLYVAFAVVAGAVGARFYWNRSSAALTADAPSSFTIFALANAVAWVWVPAIVLLSRQDSPATAGLSALGAVLLANGLRRVVPAAAENSDPEGQAPELKNGELFSATLLRHPRQSHGYVIALCLYFAGYLLAQHFYLNAGAPLAFGAFLFAWNLTFVPASAPLDASARRRAVRRLVPVTVAAVLVTLFVLLFGIGHRNLLEGARAAALAQGRSTDPNRNSRRTAAFHSGISGYESIILWPVPDRKTIVAPVVTTIAPFADRSAKPLFIRFNGPYWYFQPPGQRPGPNAYQAHGNPLTVTIEANNFFPLNMEAVQNLGAPILLTHCGEVQVEIENSDNTRGPIEIGIELADTSAPGKPSLSLGRQFVPSSEPGRFFIKISPADEVLRFPVPSEATIRQFNQIKVVYFSGAEHWQLGAKIAVEQFELLPR